MGSSLQTGKRRKKISAGILEKKKYGKFFLEFPSFGGSVPEELTICGSEEQLEGCCGKIVICERNTQKLKINYVGSY